MARVLGEAARYVTGGKIGDAGEILTFSRERSPMKKVGI
jgi:hypothetical protein